MERFLKSTEERAAAEVSTDSKVLAESKTVVFEEKKKSRLAEVDFPPSKTFSFTLVELGIP